MILSNSVAKYSLLLLMAATLAAPAAAQKKNTLQLQLGGAHYFGVLSQPISPWEQAGLEISRRVGSRFGVYAKYALIIRNKTVDPSIPFIMHHGTFDSTSIDQVTERADYFFLDAGLEYRFPLAERHSLSFKAGPSYTYGRNEYRQVHFAIGPWDDVFHATYKYKYEGYWGGTAGLSYDYLLWKERLNIGADFGARYYHDFPFSVTYGVHTGVNF